MSKGRYSVHLTQPEDFLSVRGALAGIRDDFLHQGHSAEQFLKIEMVLAEALNNIAEHGGPGVHNSPITIKWQYEQGLFSATLKDNGRPFPTAVIPDRGSPRPDVDDKDLPEGGVGWHIISQLCDSVRYQRSAGQNKLAIGLRA